ncbi:Crp/Fnr family transcriptional regulator [Oceaniglobus roseus]|uniref:Crp/Fnr family transcriptional regulator n=1 Tax=Oceaniglobus roseus TaxID=1737570 RepID=UPI0015620918|nr:Crp/Fnr family transcriptional regulator [Kandeliimicrobium roseum]
MQETPREAAGSKSSANLRLLPGFDELPEPILKELQAIVVRRSFEAGQTVVEADAPSRFTCIVRTGILRMQKDLPDGRQHIVGILVEGDLFGRVFNGNMHFSIEAATDAEILAFPRAAFEALLLRSPELDRLLLLHLLSELDRARDWMIILANPKVRGRLAGLLLLLCTRLQTVDHLVTVSGRAVRVRIPLSRPDVAHLLGTRVESVSRALHALADDGLLDIVRPDLLEIRNLQALTEEAGEPDLADTASLLRLVKAMRKSAD